MRVFVLNDTSTHNHAGCKATMRSLEQRLGDAEIVGRTYVNQRDTPARFRDADLVVMNGEGTCHHDRPGAVYMLQQLSRAQDQGRGTMLVNSVWHGMGEKWGVVLRECVRADTREVRSAQAMDEAMRAPSPRGYRPPHTYPDLSLDAVHPPTKPGPHAGRVVVGSAGACKSRTVWPKLRATMPHVSLGRDSLQDVVDELAGASCYITGQWHGVVAAMVAGVGSWSRPSNSHKIEAAREWIGADTCTEDGLWDITTADEGARYLALPRMPNLVGAQCES